MNILSVKNLQMSFGPEPVFDDLEFGVDADENVVLVGPNGVGKTTLLKLIAGEYVPDFGHSKAPSKFSILSKRRSRADCCLSTMPISNSVMSSG